MANHAPKQNSIDANVPMTTSGTPTEWEQRRRLVQAIMDNLIALMDRGSGGNSFSLRRILADTDVTLDTIRARVARQAFASGPPEAFWPSMCAVLDQFAPSWACWCANRCSGTPLMRRSGSPESQGTASPCGA